LVQVSSDLAQSEGALFLTKRALDLGPVLPALPREPGLRVHTVDHDMHVGMLAVFVRDHQCLVVVEPKIAKHTIGDVLHLLGGDVVLVIEADRQVIDRHLYERALTGRRLHERRGKGGIVRSQVAASRPCNAISLYARATGDEIAGERTKALAAGCVRDHEQLTRRANPPRARR